MTGELTRIHKKCKISFLNLTYYNFRPHFGHNNTIVNNRPDFGHYSSDIMTFLSSMGFVKDEPQRHSCTVLMVERADIMGIVPPIF